MKPKIILIALLTLFLLPGIVCASAKPIITADKTYFDVDSGLYVLKGNVYVEARGRIITAGMAKVSVGSLEVWGYGGVTVTQGDISFTGDSVYVYGAKDTAKIDGGVSFSRTGLTVTADQAEFNWRSKIGVFSGNVTVTQDGGTWTADRAVYNLATNVIE